MKTLLSLLLILLIPSTVFGRPVSYPGGITFMQRNNGIRNSAHLHYSPTARYSIGGRIDYFRPDSVKVYSMQVNNLIKRWNQEESQANLYLKSGLGVAQKGSNIDPAVYTGIATDWETRRLYASYSNKFLYAGDTRDFINQTGRVGLAPYKAEYGKIHTWLMFQVDHFPTEKHELILTPLVRAFKGPILVEAGINNRKQILFNLIYRF